MKLKREFWILAAFFIITLTIRLFFAFQTPEFSSDDAYYTLRQVEHIKQTGMLMFYDELSFGGKDQVALPGYYYILAFFDIFLPLSFVAKVLPNIFASFLVFIVYFLSLEITKRKDASLAAAFVSAFIPVFIAGTANTASVYSLSMPLMFLLIYYFIKMDEGEKHLYPFLAIFVLLSFIHASLLILIFGLLLYLLLRLLEKLKINRAEIELTLFSLFLACWFMFLFFKKAFMAHGPLIFWQNIPKELAIGQFSGFNIITSLYGVGFLPLLCGAYVVYRHLQIERKKPILLFIGIVLAVVALMAAGLIKINTGLIFFSAILSAIFGLFYERMVNFIERSKFSRLKDTIIILFFVVFILTSMVSSLIQLNNSILEVPSKEKVQALLWLKKNSPAKATILANPDEGNLVAYYAKRKNVIDSNFVLADNAQQRFKDVKTIFTISYKTNAIRLLNQYSIDYILLSKLSKEQYNIESLKYVKEEDSCFIPVYDEADALVLKSACIIEETNNE